MCKQISSNSFKNKITNKLLNYKWYMYNHVCANKWLMLNLIVFVIVMLETI